LYRRIDHIAIAVGSLQSACRIYADLLGCGNWTVEEIADQKVRVAVLPMGESRIELLEAAADDSPIAGFLSRRGEGLHHICFEVEDLAGELERLRAAGMRLIDPHPRTGAGGKLIAFLHPSGTAGVLIELSQSHAHNTPRKRSE
jgi:methylmalonyl-CoA/ethylmalonyl-CoA epimerase